MSTRYYIDGDRIHFTSESASGTFTQDDAEGYYQAYLEWVAQGNTAEEWTPEG